MAQPNTAASSSGVSASMAALEQVLGSSTPSPQSYQPAPAAPAPQAQPGPQAQPPQAMPQAQQPNPQAPQVSPQGPQPVPGQGYYPTAAPAPQGAPVAQPGIPNGQQSPPPAEEAALVPSYRVREETDRRRNAEERASAAERENVQMAAMLQVLLNQQGAPQAVAPQQQPPPPEEHPLPDLINDPIGYANALAERAVREARQAFEQEVAPIRTEVTAQKLNASWSAAVGVYGQEAASAATHAAKNAGLQDQFMATPDPVGAAVAWHQQEQARQLYGTDPATVKAKVEAELLSDPTFLARVAALASGQTAPAQGMPMPQQVQQPQAPQAYPPSFAVAPRTGTNVPMGAQTSSKDAVYSMLGQRRQSMNGFTPPARV